MPYSDGLNYVMKWKALRGRSRRVGKVRLGEEGGKESVGVEGEKVGEAEKTELKEEVKQEEEVHVRV